VQPRTRPARNETIPSVIMCSGVSAVHVYVRTADYTLGPLEFRCENVLTLPVASFLPACAQAFECEPLQWYESSRGQPAVMYEVFSADDIDQFFNRVSAPYTLLPHETFRKSSFTDCWSVTMILNTYHSGSRPFGTDFVFLCITVLDLFGLYPRLACMSRWVVVGDPEPRPVDFFFAHRSGNSIFRVPVEGKGYEALGLYLKAALRVAADYNCAPLSRARASAKLLQTMTGRWECAPSEMP